MLMIMSHANLLSAQCWAGHEWEGGPFQGEAPDLTWQGTLLGAWDQFGVLRGVERGKGAMGNVHKDDVGSRGGCEVEAHSGRDCSVYKAQEHGLVDHRSSVEQEQGRGDGVGRLGRCQTPA